MITLPDLQNKLQDLPSLIARKSFEVEKERTTYEIAKLDIKMAEGRKALEIKARNTSMTATELKLTLQRDESLYGIQMKAIGEEATYRRLQVELDKLENEFVAYRKIAEIKMRELKTLGE